MFGPESGITPHGSDAHQREGSWASSPATRNVMRGNRKRDTGPEIRLRQQLHRLGLRYQLGTRIATIPPVTPDLVFRRAQVAVFVDGCFWHGCPIHGVQPRTNVSYWSTKLSRNKQRDMRVDERLEVMGWKPVRIWEHDDPVEAASLVKTIVRSRTSDV
jgi:DNA mismatch endonuclease, patch repair protein